MSIQSPKPTRILRMTDVKKKIGLCKSSIYNRIASGTFPKPISLGGQSVGWLECSLDQWISERCNEVKAGEEGGCVEQ